MTAPLALHLPCVWAYPAFFQIRWLFQTMCGVVGIVGRQGRPVQEEVLRRMTSVLSHRGPDGNGVTVQDSVGLGHQRLAVIDLATGQQPMCRDGLLVSYNGEIYNYRELRDELKAAGHAFKTTSDTEVLLASYQAQGPEFVRRLNGMFAFVLYDPARRQVVAARDPLGIKPLYYVRLSDAVLFASEIKALLEHPEVAPAVDQEALHDYLTFQFVLEDRTLFKGVRKVQPGELLVIGIDDLTVHSTRYWEPTFAVDFDRTEEDWVEELQWLLRDSIRLQLRSDVAVGAHLSGGMDSSLVTILASEHLGHPIHTFSGAFREGPEFNELDHARLVVAQTGAIGHEIIPTAEDFIEVLPRLIYHLDEPVAGPGVFPQYMVSRYAVDHVTVVLGGQGGDEVFGGYARYLVAYLEQALKGAIYQTNEEHEHIVSLSSILPNLPTLRQYVPMLQSFWRDGVFEDMDRRYFRLIDRSGGALSLFNPEFRARYENGGVFERFSAVFNHPDTKSYYNKMTHFDLVAGLPALLHVEDRVSMAVSLESRVPLLDIRIVDLATSVPPRLRFQGGTLKHLLRKAVGGWLPRAIMERTDKMGFPVPLHLWAAGPARDFFHDTLLGTRSRQRGIIDPREVEFLLDHEQPFSRRLWGLINLELWHQRFIDG